ncbi:xanthine dehydrogenase family protein subunit M [Nocardioides sp.]|jgi:xanthine dehydrogenase YagS FAD-binding subunit|uniref:FAD binding domain-containing protein n=1 Tax=Nocardioides sp. TaxID=35761 RepID=UPI002BB137D1|nr:xanthine dehydrogenase family protein subunit M [Nocardioides sp.]HVX56023.1 xanthine dehydrogenase family protein subunit M [Nocardioides sp.]
MREHAYLRPSDPAQAVAAVTADPDASFLAGGTNLVDHLKLGIAAPGLLVDVRHLPLDAVEETDDGLRVGANVLNSDLAADRAVRERWPVVSRALLAGASGQIRHQATTAGNLLQRTRCVYFQDRTTPCNKRDPGSGCSADDDRAYGRYNAVLGASDQCVAVHPSDLAVALVACDAVVQVLGEAGSRELPLEDLHRLPGAEPHRDTTLAHGELITGVVLPRSVTSARSTYVKVRDRASFAFALVSVAAGIDLDPGTGTVRDVRLAWGGVAHRPWRARAAEDALRGAALSESTIRSAVAAELEQARPAPGAAYKLAMLRNATVLALSRLVPALAVDLDRPEEDR